ncbi:MAG: fumarylacetoacetase, partial [Acidobacteria bacterium]|nr:fumarylacetoacetase [Acidobacteriota bacterium]
MALKAVDLKSWVTSANGHPDFPLENLPFGVFRRDGRGHIGVAIGDEILDLAACRQDGVLTDDACAEETLNALMASGRPNVRKLRAQLTALLRDGSVYRERTAKHLVPQRDATMLLPARIGDYTDFYAGIHHAMNVGSMFRPDNPLLPNYKWIPIGYHGRASSIVVSGADVRRPSGQTRDDAEQPPVFGPSKRLDYELEVGAFVARGNALGEPIAIGEAEEHVFGLCIVNDWSARDIQTWEYQPLGPFLAKSFATSISPWIVTLDALESFRVPPFPRPHDDPEPLPYLRSDSDRGVDLQLEVWLQTAKMTEPVRLSRGNFRDLYWTLAQLLTHHASNGCNLQPGDLLASGTVSGTTKDSRGSLLELTWKGTEPVDLPDGEQRRFLQD